MRDEMIPERQWAKMSRDEKVRALAWGPGGLGRCPACGRAVAVVSGYWSQHTDPRSYRKGVKPEACRLELTPRTGGFFGLLTPEQKATALAYRGDDNLGSNEFRRG